MRLAIYVFPGLLTVFVRFLRLYFCGRIRVCSDTQKRLRENDATADPPTIAAVDELVCAAFEPSEFDGKALHLHTPAEKCACVN